MIPLVLLVGFLGAGKTRLLTQLVPALHRQGLRPRVILNDVQNAAVDASRLAALEALVTPLDGECICCTSLGELMQALTATRGAPGDVMLIEANGATVADELLGYLTMDRSLAHYTLPLQISVIDASRWQRRWWHNRLEAEQARTATHLVLNWTERLSTARLTAVRERVRTVNARAPFSDVAQLAALCADLSRNAATYRRREHGLPVVETHSQGTHGAMAPATARHTHPFASAVFALPSQVDRSTFERFVRQLPAQVVRAKGLVRFADRPTDMFVWNRVEGRRGLLLDASAAHADAQPSALFIGVELPLSTLADGVRQLSPTDPAQSPERPA